MTFSIDDDPRFGLFTLRTDCPRCGAHLPVNGPVAAVDCADCAARISVPTEILRDLAGGFEGTWPSVTARETRTVGDLTWRWTCEAVEGPRCSACRDPLGAKPDVCLSCGAVQRAFQAPDVLQSGSRTAAWIYDADEEGTRPVIAVAPVAMSCPQCGAGLSVTAEHQRLAPCSHCGAVVHLPDAVWRQLHPPRTVQPWIIRFEGKSLPARRAFQEAQAEAEKRHKQSLKDKQRAHQRKEAAAQRAREDAEKTARRAEQAAANAKEKRTWQLWTMPLLLLSWGMTGATVVAMGLSGVWYIAGSPAFLSAAVPPGILPHLPRIAVLAAGLLGLLTWPIGLLAIARRSRQRFWPLLPGALMQLCSSAVPVVGGIFGLVWFIQYAAGAQPQADDDKKKPLPRAATIPTGILLLAISFSSTVIVAAGMNMTVLDLLRWFGED